MNSLSELSVNMNGLTFLFWIEAKELKFLRFFTIIIVYCSIMASCPKVFQNWRENLTRPHFKAQAAQPVFCSKRIWNKLGLAPPYSKMGVFAISVSCKSLVCFGRFLCIAGF